jgi:hypothetical protein
VRKKRKKLQKKLRKTVGKMTRYQSNERHGEDYKKKERKRRSHEVDKGK